MDAESAVVGAVVGVVVGVAATAITNVMLKAKEEKDLEAQERARQEELNEARYAAYNEGWHDFSTSKNHVRNAYVKMFGDPNADSEKGTTLKSGRKS